MGVLSCSIGPLDQRSGLASSCVQAAQAKTALVIVGSVDDGDGQITKRLTSNAWGWVRRRQGAADLTKEE